MLGRRPRNPYPLLISTKLHSLRSMQWTLLPILAHVASEAPAALETNLATPLVAIVPQQLQHAAGATIQGIGGIPQGGAALTEGVARAMQDVVASTQAATGAVPPTAAIRAAAPVHLSTVVETAVGVVPPSAAAITAKPLFATSEAAMLLLNRLAVGALDTATCAPTALPNAAA